jgi:hypothetical protein
MLQQIEPYLGIWTVKEFLNIPVRALEDGQYTIRPIIISIIHFLSAGDM